MEKYEKSTLADVSWRDMLAQDPYYWLSNSFQYSENINCDDELHGIKLSQRIMSMDEWENSQLICAWDRVFVVPTTPGETIKYFDKNTNPNSTDSLNLNRFPGTELEDTEIGIPSSAKTWEAVIFQDCLWYSRWVTGASTIRKVNIKSLQQGWLWPIYDHIEDDDESISSINTKNGAMGPGINQVLNFNNTRLVCWVGEDLWVYYPELDMTWEEEYDKSTQQRRIIAFGETWWKKVQHFEAWCEIVGLTCDFEYLKVWVTDEWWNTKMYYYPGNNDLRNTFVYNIIDMTGTKVLKTYNINGIDYFTASLDWTDGYITFNKVIGDTPVQLLKQRWWLTKYDINQKAWYFVWPTSWNAEYQDQNFYIADAYGVFKFAFTPTWYDTGYLKRKARDEWQITTWLCIGWNFVFISDEDWIKAMRLYDTGVDWYESKGILISREMEWDFGGCVAKLLDEVRCHYEFNNLKDNEWDYLINNGVLGEIDIYVSPNNTRQYSDPDIDDTWRYHVMHLSGINRETRYEKMTKLSQLPVNNKRSAPVFEYDWETITYCVVIRRGTKRAQWTPVVREVNLGYHIKGKTNNIYELKNN